MLRTELLEFGKTIYDDDLLALSIELFDEVSSLKLDEKAKTTAFLINADLKRTNIQKVIEEKFGKEILHQTQLLNRMGSVSFRTTGKNAALLRKAFIELTDDISIIIIKLAERLINLRFADKNGSESALECSDECLYFYSPIAQMLGIRKIYNEMDDISFKNLYPKEFEYLTKKINERETLYNSKLASMRNDLLKALAENKIEGRLQSRIKRPYSIYRKLKNKRIPLEEVYDLLALRVITKSTENCYLTLGVVHSKWLPIEGRFRDWISYPKPNGYRSIQTTVHTRKGDKFEIQIRTEEMHEEAEFGSSAHWAYKQGETEAKTTWIQSLREFLDNDEYFDNPEQFFEKLKTEMKRNYINVLTPKGEIISLPEGATPLDFAFSVHTNLGYKTTGAKVNGKFVKLKTELKSGDVIDITSNPTASPSRDWLNIVKTSRSRSKILRWFKKNEREIYIMQGKNSWEKLKDLYRRKIRNFEDEQKLKANITKLGYKSYDDFYFAISNGAVKCSLYLLKKLYPDAFKAVDKERKMKSSFRKESSPPVRVEGLENIETKYARCCNPIKGEPIVAYITKKSMLKIHSSTCSYIISGAADRSCLKKAEWLGVESFQTVRCKIFGDNFSNMLSQVVSCAESETLNILSTQKLIQKSRLDGLYLEIEVSGISQYERFCTKLKSTGAIEVIKVV